MEEIVVVGFLVLFIQCFWIIDGDLNAQRRQFSVRKTDILRKIDVWSERPIGVSGISGQYFVAEDRTLQIGGSNFERQMQILHHSVFYWSPLVNSPDIKGQ